MDRRDVGRFATQNPRGTRAAYAPSARQGGPQPAGPSAVAPYARSAYGSASACGAAKKRRTRRIVLSVAGALVAIVVLCGVAAGLWINSIDQSLGFEDKKQADELAAVLEPPRSVSAADGSGAAEGSEAFYTLILGSDARGDEASRSDVTMLVRADPAAGQVDLVSIPRDTMVTIDGYGTQKINAAYAFGGPAGAVTVVSEFAGVPITHYAEIHFDEFERLVDAIGGVDVNVPEGFDAGNGGISLTAGEQTLNGAQALAFARERYNVSGGDFSRAQAQRIIVQAVIKKVLSANPVAMVDYVGKIAECLSTDLTVGDATDLALRFHDAGSLTMYSAVCPSYASYIDGVSYVCPMFDEWRSLMQRVDAGLDPNDESAEIPAAQQAIAELGAAANSPAPRDYAGLIGGLTTDDVVPEAGD